MKYFQLTTTDNFNNYVFYIKALSRHEAIIKLIKHLEQCGHTQTEVIEAFSSLKSKAISQSAYNKASITDKEGII